MNTPDYVTAIETRMQWQAWMITAEGRRAFSTDGPFGQAKRAGEAIEMRMAYQNYWSAIRDGDMYVMAPEFCRLVDHARAAVPRDFAWDPKWLLSRSGWLWITEPPRVPKITGANPAEWAELDLRMQAVSWTPIPPGVDVANALGRRQAGVDWYHAQLWCVAAGRREVFPFWPWSYPVLRPGATLAERTAEFEADARMKQQGDDYELPGIEHELAWLYVAAHLMAQRLSVTVPQRTARAVRRRHAEASPPVPDVVQIVTLRRLQADRQREGAEHVVDWQWQWDVVGHWRQQYYPSENVHKRVFIEKYRKGPEDKPLKPSTMKVFRASR